MAASILLSVPVMAATITFQNGLNGYTGTLDIELWSGGTRSSSATTITVDDNSGTTSDSQALVRFDNLFGSGTNQIQQYSLINTASLVLDTVDLTTSNVSVYRVLQTWNNSTTWANSFGANGVQNNGTEASSTASGTITGTSLGTTTSTISVLNDVLAWQGGASNFGWAFLPSSSNGWDFATSENATTTSRPSLTVTFDAPRTWLGDDTTRGGVGTWANTGGTAWSATNADGGPGVAWDTGAPALFAGSAASTVTVSGSVTANGGLIFLVNGSSISGGTGIALSSNASRATILTESGVTASIATNLTGSAGMTKNGTGTLVLTGDKTYTGGTTVSAGTLQLGDGTTNGSVTGNITNNGALAFNNASAQTYAGTISGTGTLAKSGAGTLTLSAASNTYTGKTTITGGLVSASGESRFGANPGAFTADQITLNGGGVQATAGSNINFSSNRGITLGASGGTFDSAGSDTITLTNVVTGTGALTKTGSGNLVFAGAHTYAGDTNIQQGRATLTTGTNRLPTGTTLRLGSGSNSGTFALGGFNQTVAALATSGTGTANTIENASATNATLTVNGAANSNYGGVIQNGTGAGTFALQKSGAGTLTLTGNNTYTGGSSITAGTVVAGSNTALGANPVTMSDGSLFGAAGVTTANAITIGTAAGTASNPFTISWNFATAAPSSSNAVGFTVGDVTRGNNNGTTTLLGSGSASSGYTSASGTNNAGAATINGALNTATSTYFEFNLARTTATTVSLNDVSFGSRSTGTGPTAYSIRSTGDLATSLASGTLLTNSTWALQAPAFTDTAIANAAGTTFRIYGSGGTGAVVNTAVWRIDDLTLTGISTTATAASGTGTVGIAEAGTATFSGPITVNNTATLTAVVGGTANFSGAIDGTGSLTKTDAGTVVLSGNNGFTGNTTVSSGVLNIQHANALGTTTAGTSVTSGAAVEIQGGITVGAEALTLNGTGVSSGGALRNVSGNNTYGGAITQGSATRIASDASTLTLPGTITTNGFSIEFGGAGNVSLPTANQLIGSGTLVKNGAGTLTITQVQNGGGAFTGKTIVNGGFVELAGGGARLGITPGTFVADQLTLDGGGIRLSAGSGSQGLTASQRGLTLGSAGGTVDVPGGSDTATFNSMISGTGSLTKTGPGTAVLNDTPIDSSTLSNYTGATTISAGTLQVGAGGTTGSLGNTSGVTNNGTLRINRSNAFAIAQNITGTGGFEQTGTGTTTLTGTNTFSGATTITAGTLAAATEDALGGTSGITVNTGGTLLLSNTGTMDRINDSATITMAGGTIAFSGNVTEGSSPGTGALTLTASSIIDFLGGDAIINFGASNLATWTGGAILSIYNWAGSTLGGGSDQLLFGSNSSALTSGQLGQISFYSDAGTTFLGTGAFVGSLGEVVPVPEPSSLLMIAGLLGLATWREHRRWDVLRAKSRRNAAQT